MSRTQVAPGRSTPPSTSYFKLPSPPSANPHPLSHPQAQHPRPTHPLPGHHETRPHPAAQDRQPGVRQPPKPLQRHSSLPFSMPDPEPCSARPCPGVLALPTRRLGLRHVPVVVPLPEPRGGALRQQHLQPLPLHVPGRLHRPPLPVPRGGQEEVQLPQPAPPVPAGQAPPGESPLEVAGRGAGGGGRRGRRRGFPGVRRRLRRRRRFPVLAPNAGKQEKRPSQVLPQVAVYGPGTGVYLFTDLLAYLLVYSVTYLRPYPSLLRPPRWPSG